MVLLPFILLPYSSQVVVRALEPQVAGNIYIVGDTYLHKQVPFKSGVVLLTSWERLLS